MTKLSNTPNFKQSPQSAGHKRSRPLSSVTRLPSLSVLVISDTNSKASSSSSKMSTATGPFFLAPRKGEFRKGWGSFKSRQRYSSLSSLDSSSTVSTTMSSSTEEELTPSGSVKCEVSFDADAWGFFADL